MKRNILTLLTIVLFIAQAKAQGIKDNFYIQVLSQELQRNSTRLQLPDLGKPFFISYGMRNDLSQTISAERGKITSLAEHPSNNKIATIKLRVGNYHRNFDYMFSDPSYVMLPDEENATEYKRLLWIETDKAYKNNAQEFNASMTALKNVTVDKDELAIDDMAHITPVVNDFGGMATFDTEGINQWKPILEKLSALFIPYSFIITSNCSLTLNNWENYLVTNEGTNIRRPGTQTGIFINAAIAGNEGTSVNESYAVFANDLKELPTYTELEKVVKGIIIKLQQRDTAKKFEGSYLGPVLFEGHSMATLINTFFRYQLGVNRKSILFPDYSGNFYEDKLGQKLIATDLSLTAKPHLKSFQGLQTTGSFDIDNEGVVPGDSLVLVQDGILKNLLNGRTPTKKFPTSMGFSFGERSYSAGVLEFRSKTTSPADSIKYLLIKAAKEEGLPCAYIVKETPILPGKLPYIYRIDTATMKEELLTDVNFTNFNMRSLRRFITASNNMQLYNQSQYSIICPQSMIIGEVELEAENNVVKAKPIIVSNPLDKKSNTPLKLNKGTKKPRKTAAQ